ncbi:MAG TPA: hypothetical protein VFJ58_16370 [Armatimonadota bacterium]|nr:hypothetical protein [Armatimonadota bacterium]
MQNNNLKAGLIAGGVFVLLGSPAAGLFMLMRPGSTPIPASFTAFSAPDGSFAGDGPTGWATTSSSANAVAGGTAFQSGSARISIVSDLAGSLVGDLSRSADASLSSMSGMVPGLKLPQVLPVQKVHDMGKKSMEDLFKSYQEQPAQAFQARFGDARISEFTADGGWMAGSLRGYRVTMLSNDRRVSIVCRCSAGDWNNLHPAFIHVINSIGPGKGGG